MCMKGLWSWIFHFVFLGGSDISAEAIKLSAKAAGSISDSGLFLQAMYLKAND